jgi:hypothetical protein
MDNLEPKSEELDQEFLQELNTLTKQLKTDEEIQKDIKSNQNLNKIDKEKIKQENNINENPFQEAFDKMNSNNQNSFGFENGDLMFESLNSLNSTMNQFNSLLNNTINSSNNNTEGEKNIQNQNEINEKQNHILEEILDFLIQSNLLKDTILNMKKSIEDSKEKNKNDLKPEEDKKYQEALLNSNNILDEINKIHPDKEKIMDSLQKLQKISNDIDCILKI